MPPYNLYWLPNSIYASITLHGLCAWPLVGRWATERLVRTEMGKLYGPNSPLIVLLLPLQVLVCGEGRSLRRPPQASSRAWVWWMS